VLRRNAMRTGVGLAILAAASFLALMGLGVCLWAAYQGLAGQLGPVNAAFLIGILMLLLAGLMAWTAIRLAR
jgi:hypothetical protein